jgi:hypothetical protein
MEIVLGSDPEFFLVEKGKFDLVPPYYLQKYYGLKVLEYYKDIVPNEEEEIGKFHPIYFKNNLFNIMMDGALFEATITPSTNPIDIHNQIQEVINKLEELGKPYGLVPLHRPVATLDIDKFFTNVDDELVRQSVIAGCDPAFDAIDESFISKVVSLDGWKIRAAGGHLHASVEGINLHKDIKNLVKLLAIHVGTLTTLLSEFPEEELQRMEVFGAPGRYRPQTYPNNIRGVEYRTPSNSWLRNLDIIERVFEATKKAIQTYIEGNYGKMIFDYLEPAVYGIMNVDSSACEYVLENIGVI